MFLLSSLFSNANAQILEGPCQFEQISRLGMCSPKIHTQYQCALQVWRISECYAMYLNLFLAPQS